MFRWKDCNRCISRCGKKLTSLGPIFSEIMSGSHVNRSSPVSLRRRLQRRCKMFGELVSGRKKNSTTKQNPESHMSSQIVQVQLRACTANPPTRGPSTGPATAPTPQTANPYACFWGRYMSAMVAPPVARAGEPKKPVRKRKARSMPKLTDSAVGICNKTKTTGNAMLVVV
jgi:hypothetical protein